MAEDLITERGKQTAVEMFGPNGPAYIGERMGSYVERVDEDWARIFSNYVINGMYSRNVLPTNIRELCAVAALTILQSTQELRGHIRIALRCNPSEQVREVILQMSVYGGIPLAVSTLRILEEVRAEPEFSGV